MSKGLYIFRKFFFQILRTFKSTFVFTFRNLSTEKLINYKKTQALKTNIEEQITLKNFIRQVENIN